MFAARLSPRLIAGQIRPATRTLSTRPSPASSTGQKSGHVLGDEAPGRQGARRAHSRSYVTDEQRSRPGWIGGQNVPEILNGGARASARPRSRCAPGQADRAIAREAVGAVSDHGCGRQASPGARLAAAWAGSPRRTAGCPARAGAGASGRGGVGRGSGGGAGGPTIGNSGRTTF